MKRKKRLQIAIIVLALLGVTSLVAYLGIPKPTTENTSADQTSDSSTSSKSSAPKETTKPKPSAKPKPKVTASAGREIVIEKVGIHATVDAGDCPMVNGALNPPLMETTCFYAPQGSPYSLPSSNQPDLAVLAGHAGALVPAVFDPLYNMSTFEQYLSKGDELKVKTESSGDTWLVYKATDFHTPLKHELPNKREIWGDEPTPGRLVLLTCLQPEDRNQASVRNVVIGFQFDRVES